MQRGLAEPVTDRFRQPEAVLTHLESHLGSIADRVDYGPDAANIPMSVARFVGQPTPDAECYVTIGLSETPLHDPSRGVFARQELLFCQRSGSEPEQPSVPLVLAMLARAAIAAEKIWPVGRVIELGGPLFSNSAFTALYATSGTYFPTQVVLIEGTDPPIEISWLLPLHASEAAAVRHKGWQAFEEILEQHEPDLLDLSRPPILTS